MSVWLTVRHPPAFRANPLRYRLTVREPLEILTALVKKPEDIPVFHVQPYRRPPPRRPPPAAHRRATTEARSVLLACGIRRRGDDG